MSDPANPKQTASLVTPAMQTPHESLLLNERRGLLAAVTGNPAFYPGIVDVYDLNEDCRTPALQSSLPVGRMQLWAPGTTGVGDQRSTLSKQSGGGTARGQQISFNAPVVGTYFLEVRAGNPTRDRPVYELTVAQKRG